MRPLGFALFIVTSVLGCTRYSEDAVESGGAVRLGDLADEAVVESSVDLSDLDALVERHSKVLFDGETDGSAVEHAGDWVGPAFFGADGTALKGLRVRAFLVTLTSNEPVHVRYTASRRLDPTREGVFALGSKTRLTEELLREEPKFRGQIGGGRRELGRLEEQRSLEGGRVEYSLPLRPPARSKSLMMFVVFDDAAPIDGSFRALGLEWPQWKLLGSEPIGASPYFRAMTVGESWERCEVFLLGSPGRMTFRVRVPRVNPVLNAEAMPFLLRRGKPRGVRVDVTDGDVSRSVSATVRSPKDPWVPLRLELSEFAGRAAEITLSVERLPDEEPGSIVVFRRVVLSSGEPIEPPDVILISMDTVRADRMSLYGNLRRTTPFIDELASTMVTFETAVAPSNWTLPSHVSIFSGQYPDRHGVYDDFGRLHPETPWIVDEFRAAGYRTAGVTGGGYVQPRFGFSRGFEEYGTTDPACPPMDWARARPKGLGGRADEEAKKSARCRRELLDLVRGERGRPLFLFVHTYQGHEYRATPKGLRRFGAAPKRMNALLEGVYGTGGGPNPFFPTDPSDDELRSLGEDARLIYDAALLEVDGLVRDVVEAQRARGRLENTILIITSDHGEALFERGAIGHGKTLFEEQIRVPLLILAPGIASSRQAEPVSLVDLVPTLRELCRLAPPPAASSWSELEDGRSLVPVLQGERVPARPTLSRSGSRHRNDAALWALRGRRLKFHRTDKPNGAVIRDLFDLTEDPDEIEDLSEARPEDSDRLAGGLVRLVKGLRAVGGAGLRARMDSAAIAELEALGYLGDD